MLKINYNNFNHYNTSFKGPVTKMADNKDNSEIKKITQEACSGLAKIAEREVPENGDFRKVYITYKIPFSDNNAIIAIEVDKKNSKTQRYLVTGVHRDFSDRLLTNYLENGTKKELITNLNNADKQKEILESIEHLAKRVDDYYASH